MNASTRGTLQLSWAAAATNAGGRRTAPKAASKRRRTRAPKNDAAGGQKTKHKTNRSRQVSRRIRGQL
eukprot:1203962-Pyramimonas_sp.AAC.1